MKVPQSFAVELNENQSWIFLMFLQECSASFRLQTLVQSSGRDVTCLLQTRSSSNSTEPGVDSRN